MSRQLWLAFAILLLFPAFAKAINEDSLWVYEHYTKKEVYIPMRDGKRLFASVYLPKDNSEKHPVLMTRTPYSCAPYGEDKFRPFWNSYVLQYMKEGYIMVIEDVRGRWMSEGTFMDVRPFNPNKKDKNDIPYADFSTHGHVKWRRPSNSRARLCLP